MMAHLRDLPPFPLLQFYATSPYDCSYLPNRQARSQVSTPTHLIDAATYSQLVKIGFRRSGVFTYRPWCDHCNECLPVRIPVAQFQPNRSQRRAQKQHTELQVSEQPLLFQERHYDLYLRYQYARHWGGGMDNDSREQYAQFLLQTHVDTRLIEFCEGDELRMVSIIDVLDDGLSSVYTFYDTALSHASLGTYAILWQLEQCRCLGLPYLYLGYWIRNSDKMSYKQRFRPIEGFRQQRWSPLQDIL